MTTMGNDTRPRSHNDLRWSAALNADNLTLSKDGVADDTYDITGRTVNQFCAALATGNYAWSVRGCLVRGTVDTVAGTVTLGLTDAGFGPGHSDTVTSRTITGVTNPYVFLLQDALVVAQLGAADANFGDSRVTVACKAMVTFGAKEIPGDAHGAQYAALSWTGGPIRTDHVNQELLVLYDNFRYYRKYNGIASTTSSVARRFTILVSRPDNTDCMFVGTAETAWDENGLRPPYWEYPAEGEPTLTVDLGGGNNELWQPGSDNIYTSNNGGMTLTVAEARTATTLMGGTINSLSRVYGPECGVTFEKPYLLPFLHLTPVGQAVFVSETLGTALPIPDNTTTNQVMVPDDATGHKLRTNRITRREPFFALALRMENFFSGDRISDDADMNLNTNLLWHGNILNVKAAGNMATGPVTLTLNGQTILLAMCESLSFREGSVYIMRRATGDDVSMGNGFVGHELQQIGFSRYIRAVYALVGQGAGAQLKTVALSSDATNRVLYANYSIARYLGGPDGIQARFAMLRALTAKAGVFSPLNIVSTAFPHVASRGSDEPSLVRSPYALWTALSAETYIGNGGYLGLRYTGAGWPLLEAENVFGPSPHSEAALEGVVNLEVAQLTASGTVQRTFVSEAQRPAVPIQPDPPYSVSFGVANTVYGAAIHAAQVMRDLADDAGTVTFAATHSQAMFGYNQNDTDRFINAFPEGVNLMDYWYGIHSFKSFDALPGIETENFPMLFNLVVAAVVNSGGSGGSSGGIVAFLLSLLSTLRVQLSSGFGLARTGIAVGGAVQGTRPTATPSFSAGRRGVGQIGRPVRWR